MNKCPYCNTTYREILQTRFVGCQHCYAEIDELKISVKNLYAGKKYKGRRGGGHGNI